MLGPPKDGVVVLQTTSIVLDNLPNNCSPGIANCSG